MEPRARGPVEFPVLMDEPRKKTRSRRNTRCFKCNKYGHKKSECTAYKPRKAAYPTRTTPEVERVPINTGEFTLLDRIALRCNPFEGGRDDMLEDGGVDEELYWNAFD
jgi:hypothetical protein